MDGFPVESRTSEVQEVLEESYAISLLETEGCREWSDLLCDHSRIVVDVLDYFRGYAGNGRRFDVVGQ